MLYSPPMWYQNKQEWHSVTAYPKRKRASLLIVGTMGPSRILSQSGQTGKQFFLNKMTLGKRQMFPNCVGNPQDFFPTGHANRKTFEQTSRNTNISATVFPRFPRLMWLKLSLHLEHSVILYWYCQCRPNGSKITACLSQNSVVSSRALRTESLPKRRDLQWNQGRIRMHLFIGL